MSNQTPILIVDDDPDVLLAAKLTLSGLGRPIVGLDTAERLPEVLAEQTFCGALLDMNFRAGQRSGEDGLAALRAIKSSDSAIAVVLMTVYGSVGLAVEALKQGASDFVLKPWRNDKLCQVVSDAIARTDEARRNRPDWNLERIERQTIQAALQAHDGNLSHAAAELGLTRQTLYRRLAKHELES